MWRTNEVSSVNELCSIACGVWRTNVVWSVEDYCSVECGGIMYC